MKHEDDYIIPAVCLLYAALTIFTFGAIVNDKEMPVDGAFRAIVMAPMACVFWPFYWSYRLQR